MMNDRRVYIGAAAIVLVVAVFLVWGRLSETEQPPIDDEAVDTLDSIYWGPHCRRAKAAFEAEYDMFLALGRPSADSFDRTKDAAAQCKVAYYVSDMTKDACHAMLSAYRRVLSSQSNMEAIEHRKEALEHAKDCIF